jgi:putative endonuclease
VEAGWYVYMIRCSDNSLYTGISTDPYRRFEEHKNHKGAKYFYARSPVKLVYLETSPDRSSASKRECFIKKLQVNKKHILITSAKNQLS